MQSLKSIVKFNMPKLMKKAIRKERSDGRADPNYRKASHLKRIDLDFEQSIFRKISIGNIITI